MLPVYATVLLTLFPGCVPSYVPAEVAAESASTPSTIEPSPYAGGWPTSPCGELVGPTGWNEGDVLLDFALIDQFGDTVHLYDFCDRTIFVVTVAFW